MSEAGARDGLVHVGGCSIAWYDRQIGWSERFLLGNARRWAVEQVNGVVVEIGVGHRVESAALRCQGGPA